MYAYASLVAQMVKRLPAMRETWVRFLGWEDPLEKEMAIHYSTLAWEIPWMEEPAVILELKKMKSDTVSTVSPSISHEVMGPDAMIFIF